MGQTWNMFPTWGIHVIRAVLVSMILFVSSCTVPGRWSSTSPALTPDGGQVGPMIQGNGDSGQGM
jgi:hypothetical protein